jgi:hypothetical protein
MEGEGKLMHTMKKLLLILTGLALILTLCILSGCTGGGSSSESDTEAVSDSTATDTPTDPAAEQTTEPDTAAESEPVDDTTPVTETEAGTDTEAEPETTTEPETVNYFESTKIELVEPDTSKVADMAIAADGYDIYQLTEGNEWGYRYGCTYLYNEDGSIDAYFACTGTISGEWDWISYRHSPDGGETWEDEKIVLTPTQNSMDHYSCCDPGVVYFNGYYYLGYTSTLNGSGYCNNLFVARSKTPDGPFEKWNGSGWGGTEPQPIVYFDENWQSWGIGEPSFVELNGTLYMYYTSTSPSGGYCMVATADATDENWPATLTFHGQACKKGSNDSLDIKYVEEWGKFVGVCTADRMSASSWLAVYESNDGLTFELVDAVREGTYAFLHNAGLSSRPNGHIRITEDADKLRVIYAYGNGWGVWNTRVQPITLTLSDGNNVSAEKSKANIPDPVNRTQLIPEDSRYITMVRTACDLYQYSLDKSSFTLRVYTYDTYFTSKVVARKDELLSFTDYDESVITISETGKVTIVGVGETTVTVHYGDLVNVFYVKITETNEVGSSTEAVGFEPVRDTYVIAYNERGIYHPQIRGQIKWASGTFTELYVQASDEVVTFEGYDESIISVGATGIITAKKVGETDVVVSCRGMSFVVHVVVTADSTQGHFTMDEIETLDYANLDFSHVKTQEAFSGTNNCTIEATGEAIKLTVTDISVIDPIVVVGYSSAADVLNTADYDYLEITYMVPTDVSSKATRLQVFVCVGDVTAPSAAYQVTQTLIVDGEYHTMKIKMSDLSYWVGTINALRIDFFDACEPGDVMYIQSIRLTSAQ